MDEDVKVRLLNYPLEEWDVVEVGCGASGLVAAALGPVVHKYLATDHLKSVLRQAENNIVANVPRRLVTTLDGEVNAVESKFDNNDDYDDDDAIAAVYRAARKEQEGKIQCVEFDWEDMDSGINSISKILGSENSNLNVQLEAELQGLNVKDEPKSTRITENLKTSHL